MSEENITFPQMNDGNRKKYLFLMQKQTLDQFLERGALSQEQYDFSYNGLITKMNITSQEISLWLGESSQKE